MPCRLILARSAAGATVGALLETTQPIEGGHRMGREIRRREPAALLGAIEQDAVLVTELPADVTR